MKPAAPSQRPLWIYLPLWFFFAYLFVQILNFQQGNINNVFLGGMYFVLFGIHEVAHIVTGFLPPILTAAAGSLSEVAFASLLVYAAFRAKSSFAGIFSLLWLMLALTSMGNYMADARAQAMPLIGPSPDPQHDWAFVFGQLGLLDADIVIGTTIRIIGIVIGALGLLFGLALIANRAAKRD